MTLRAISAIAAFALISTGCVGIGGEKIPVLHDELSAVSGRASGPVRLAAAAEDNRDKTTRIGRATFTVFAITTGSITTKDPVEQEVSRAIADALTHSGFDVEVVDSEASGGASAGIVVAEIKDFWFRNYNWFWPIVPTWGDITLGLRVSDASGRKTYEKSFEGGGTSFCILGNCAFKAAVRRAMNELLDDVVEAVTKDDFRAALENATSSVTSVNLNLDRDGSLPEEPGDEGAAP